MRRNRAADPSAAAADFTSSVRCELSADHEGSRGGGGGGAAFEGERAV